MVNVNRNSALDTLQGLVEQSFLNNLQNMPEEFNRQQQEALNLFKQRIFLDEVIEKSIEFNRKINFEKSKEINIVRTAEELIEVFKLRSDIYTQINYQEEFPDTIEGLNFDLYDKQSAILFTKTNNTLSSTIKVIYDKQNKLPSEEKVSFDYLRENNSQIVELSRFVVKNSSNGLSQDFKYLFRGVYQLFKENEIDLILSSIKKEHFKMYDKFGGVTIEKELNSYGLVDLPFLVLSWDPTYASAFFKKIFLNLK